MVSARAAFSFNRLPLWSSCGAGERATLFFSLYGYPLRLAYAIHLSLNRERLSVFLCRHCEDRSDEAIQNKKSNFNLCPSPINWLAMME